MPIMMPCRPQIATENREPQKLIEYRE